MPLQLQTSSLEDLLCSHAPHSSNAASPGCVTSSQASFKAFLSPVEPRGPRSADRKLSPLLTSLQDPLVDKGLLEPREMAQSKKVCFSESSLPLGDRTRRTYYLNGMVGGRHLWAPGIVAGSWGGQLGTAAPSTQHREDQVAGKPGSGAVSIQICYPFKEN